MNRIFAVRNETTVSIHLNGQSFQYNFDTEDQAKALFNKALEVKRNPSDENVTNLRVVLDPNYRLETIPGIERSNNGNFYLKGYNIPIPSKLIQRIIKYSEEGYPIDALINFWKLCMMNPDPIARQDLFSFADRFAFPITDSGYFIAYKSVAWAGKKNEDQGVKIAQEYVYAKAAGEDPNTFTVYSLAGDFYVEKNEVVEQMIKEEGEWLKESFEFSDWIEENHPLEWAKVGVHLNGDLTVYEKFARELGWTEPDWEAEWIKQVEFKNLGTLQEAFEKINELFQTDNPEFTDHHTHSMKIKLGQALKMDREDCDANPDQTCSSGLHVGAPGYVASFGGRGSYILACLVNPAHVVAVPKDYSYEKMRVCEYFPYAICEFDDNGKIKEIDTPYFETDYSTVEAKELEEAIKQYEGKPAEDLSKEEIETATVMRERLILINA